MALDISYVIKFIVGIITIAFLLQMYNFQVQIQILIVEFKCVIVISITKNLMILVF